MSGFPTQEWQPRQRSLRWLRPSRREWLLVLLGSLCYVFITYLTPPSYLLSQEWGRLHEFYKEFSARALLAGRLPLWNPYVGLGRPFLADIETGLFYPPNLVYLVTSPKIGIVILSAAHAVLAVLATAALARALGVRRPLAFIAGFAFLACGAVTGCIQFGQVHYGFGFAYLPLVLFCALRLQEEPGLRAALRLAVVLCLDLLATHPQFFWITLVAVAAFLLGRRMARPLVRQLLPFARDVLGLCTALAMACALAAVQLLPFWELIGQGNRPLPSLQFSSAWSLDWKDLASLAVVYPHPNWANDLFVGALVLVAGFGGLVLGWRERNGRGLAALGFFALLVALAANTPLFPLLYRVLPGLSLFRIHSRTAVLLCFTLVLAAGRFLSTESLAPQALRRVLIAGATCVLAAMIAAMIWRGASAKSLAMAGGEAVASLALLSLWWRWPGDTRRRALVAAGLALPLLSGFAHAAFSAKRTNAVTTDFPGEVPLVELLRRQNAFDPNGVPPRVSVPIPWVRENAGMHYGFSTFNGYVGLSLDRVWTYIHRASGVPMDPYNVSFPSPQVFEKGPDPFLTMNLVAGFNAREKIGSFNLRPDPRVYLVTRATRVRHWHDAMSAIERGHNVHDAALIEAPFAPILDPAPAGSGQAKIVSFRAERVEIEVDSPGRALLVLGEAWYPGWQASVNGAAAPCEPANVWMRAVPVPPGRSRVVLEYHCEWLVPGATVSGLSLFLLAMLHLRSRRATRQARSPALGSPTRQSTHAAQAPSLSP